MSGILFHWELIAILLYWKTNCIYQYYWEFYIKVVS